MDSSESECGDRGWLPSVLFCSGVLWLCCYTWSKDLHLSLHTVLFCLCVLTSVVVVAEEGKNTDDQTHDHKQSQGSPEKSPTQGNLRTNLIKKNQDLLHPPVKITTSYGIDLIHSLLLTDVYLHFLKWYLKESYYAFHLFWPINVVTLSDTCVKRCQSVT